MRFSSRSKVSVVFSLVALVALVAAFAIGFASKPGVHAASSATTFKGVLSTAKQVAQVNAASLSKSNAVKATAHAMPLHARPGSTHWYQSRCERWSAKCAEQQSGSGKATAEL